LSYSPEKNISYIDIYKEVDGEFIYAGMISPRQKEIYIDGLELGTEYSYKLVPYNYDGVSGDAVEVTGSTIIPEYTITEQSLLKNGSSVPGITSSGRYAVKTVVTDYLLEDMKYSQVVAVYKDNTLQKLYTDNASFTAGGKEAEGKEIITNIEIGGGTGWTVELHMWDGIETMNILAPCVTFSN
jgi:hypothetical protein